MNENADKEFMKLAIEQSKLCNSQDKRDPLVGAVVVKDGQLLEKAFKGERILGEKEPQGDHAEYTVLEKKLEKEETNVVGATVYTTLEPCTIRKHPGKFSCAGRLIERKVREVVIGMLDPNPDMLGKGVLALRNAGMEVRLFDSEHMKEVEALNREFIRYYRKENIRIPAGTSVRDSRYRFSEVIDEKCKNIVITGHNFADLLGTRGKPPSQFHQLIIRALKQASRPTVTLVFAPPELLRASHVYGYQDLINNSIPRLLDLQNDSQLSVEEKSRLDIICHKGAQSLSAFIRDPDDEERGLIVITPRWLTDTQGGRRMYFALRRALHLEPFRAIWEGMQADLRDHQSIKTLNQIAQDYGVS